jgi:hypothetical protein
MTESVVTEGSIYTTSSSSAAAKAPLHSDAGPVERPPPPRSSKENSRQLPNADTGSENNNTEEFRVEKRLKECEERLKECQVQDTECNERGNDGETEDYFSDDEEYQDYVYESLLDETEFSQGISGYMEGFEPPIIHDISPAYSARRKFSDEQIPSSIKEDENNSSSNKYNSAANLICANCGGRSDGCGGGQFCI